MKTDQLAKLVHRFLAEQGCSRADVIRVVGKLMDLLIREVREPS